VFVVVLRFQCVCGCVVVQRCLWLCWGPNVFVVVLRFQWVCGCVLVSICGSGCGKVYMYMCLWLCLWSFVLCLFKGPIVFGVL